MTSISATSTKMVLFGICCSASKYVSGFAPHLERSFFAATTTPLFHNHHYRRAVVSSKISLTTATTTSEGNDNDISVSEPLVVCGPSGVGKGTIITKFMEEMKGNTTFGFTVSHTTRSPREGEIDGIHYHFVEVEDMKRAIKEGEFLEHAEVHGNFYGTSRSSLRDVEKDGKRCLLDIDVQGVQNIKTLESDILKPKYVFIAPPSMESLKERLINRGSESEETLARRTANAQREVDYGLEDGNFDAIVVNEDLDTACKDFAQKIQDLFGG